MITGNTSLAVCNSCHIMLGLCIVMVCRPLGSTFPGLSVVLGPESDRLATCTNLGLELCLWTAGQAICTHQDLPLYNDKVLVAHSCLAHSLDGKIPR